MGRIWLVRGGVVAVLAVLVGAWAVGLVGLGNSPSPTAERDSPASSESSTVPDYQRSALREKAKTRRTRQVAPSPDAVTRSSPDTAYVPADDATAPAPSPNAPDLADPSEEPSDSPPPPTNPPSRPADDCSDLVAVIDCALDPTADGP